MFKKFIASLLTATSVLSSLPNQSAGAIKNINSSSPMIGHSSSIHKSNGKNSGTLKS
ncbi:MAG: hypothetical protein Q4B84_05580 [Clostridia bacterium]|nr:hypothetical protein [Clostridia bacterium]